MGVGLQELQVGCRWLALGCQVCRLSVVVLVIVECSAGEERSASPGVFSRVPRALPRAQRKLMFQGERYIHTKDFQSSTIKRSFTSPTPEQIGWFIAGALAPSLADLGSVPFKDQQGFLCAGAAFYAQNKPLLWLPALWKNSWCWWMLEKAGALDCPLSHASHGWPSLCG